MEILRNRILSLLVDAFIGWSLMIKNVNKWDTSNDG